MCAQPRPKVGILYSRATDHTECIGRLFTNYVYVMFTSLFECIPDNELLACAADSCTVKTVISV